MPPNSASPHHHLLPNSPSIKPPSGLLLIDKPAGLTSFGVVARVRRHLSALYDLKKLKVGHTGTLDPFATGLLPLLIGSATKQSDRFLKLDKIYDATLKFGISSTTGDPEGELTPELNPKIPNSSELNLALKSFRGMITQTLPRFSAIKINGRRAYDLARRGETFAMPTRSVEIHHLEVLGYHYPVLELRCHVSSGTYIRTLAEDLAKSLDTTAYLTALRRLKVGHLELFSATPLDQFLSISTPSLIDDLLHPLS